MRMWVNGEGADSVSGQVIEVTDPATEEVVDIVPSGTSAGVDHAVAAAKVAYPLWWSTPAVERARLLHQAAAKMRADFDALVRLLTLEEGKPIPENNEQVRVGTIWINDPLTDNCAGPFAGMKMSDLGREPGEEGIEESWQTKHVHWDIDGGYKDYWYLY